MDNEIIVNNTKVAYSRKGKGTPMILMHGWGCDRNTLTLFERVGLEDHEVFNIDLPGFGKSPEPPFAWTVEDYTKMLEEFTVALGIKNPIILGHSFGGRIGILYASRNKLESLILVDSAGVKPRHGLKYQFKVLAFKLSKLWLKLTLGKAKAEERIRQERNRRGSADYRNASPLMKQVLVKAVNTDLCHVMPRIQAPTLLLWGENDTATPLSDAKKMNRLIPNSNIVSFAGAGHFCFIDTPYQAAAAVRHVTSVPTPQKA